MLVLFFIDSINGFGSGRCGGGGGSGHHTICGIRRRAESSFTDIMKYESRPLFLSVHFSSSCLIRLLFPPPGSFVFYFPSCFSASPTPALSCPFFLDPSFHIFPFSFACSFPYYFPSLPRLPPSPFSPDPVSLTGLSCLRLSSIFSRFRYLDHFP